jgi:hypothetical protein
MDSVYRRGEEQTELLPEDTIPGTRAAQPIPKIPRRTRRRNIKNVVGTILRHINLDVFVWSLFWSGIFFLLFIAIQFHRELGLKQPTKLLIAVAIWSTAIFAHFSVLLPFIRPTNGLTRYAKSIFTMIVGNGVISFLLGIYYFDAAVHTDGQLWINIQNVKSSMVTSFVFATDIFDVVRFVLGFHTLVFVLGITIMDWLIYKGASSKHARKEFWDIVVFIDCPMVLGVAYTAAIGPSLPAGEEFFVAGAVALQLFVANIQLLLFRIFSRPKLFRQPTDESACPGDGIAEAGRFSDGAGGVAGRVLETP